MDKICPICGITKSIDDFYRHPETKDGRRNKCKICWNIKNREWRNRNKDKIKTHKQKMRSIYRERYRKRKTVYELNKRKNDISYRILHNMGSRLNSALKYPFKYGEKIEPLIGCSIFHLIGYFENMFQVGMTWENYGRWHIDHIKPCASFDLIKKDERRKCFHYTNLQPLWASDNCRKNKY